jgi:hypothetical protein
MPTPDLNQGQIEVKNKISAIKNFAQVSNSEKKLKRSAGNSESQGIPDIASSLDNASKDQKRYLKPPPNSFDQVLEMIGLTSGNGSETLKYLKKKLLLTATKIEPEIKKIITKNAIKALGCSQEQTFQGFTSTFLELNPLNTLPVGQGIYVPIESMDISGMLKTTTDSKIGKVVYEKPKPSVLENVFKPYKGKVPFPMNKEFNNRLQGTFVTDSFNGEYGKYYQGVSNQNLFDFQYSPTNQFGVDQACFKVALISKVNESLTITGGSANKVIDFLEDYYGTIKLFDTTDFTAVMMNAVSGAINIKANLTSDEISKQSQFMLILQRILGLCFDSRREIDVSGVSKIAELDGVDESFFELTEIDLRNIDVQISNIQNGVMELVDCDNVKVPVDYETIIDGLIDLRETENLSSALEVNKIIAISDSLVQNPDWKVLLPTNLNLQVFDEDFIKKIPLSVAGAVLSPKVLFPIFVLMQSLESNATNSFNSAVTSANTFIQSANTIGNSVNNLINSNVDFLKTFKKFNIEMVAEIGAIFVTELFNILKKDLINLMRPIITDIGSEALKAKLQMIERLITIALIINQIVIGVKDYKKCKSLIDDILIILNLISSLAPPGSKIPKVLLLLANFLPGTSASRASINTIEELQKLGIPTGTLPDGSPNLMLLFNLASNKATKKESAQNGKIQAIGISADGKPVRISGKST